MHLNTLNEPKRDLSVVRSVGGESPQKRSLYVTRSQKLREYDVRQVLNRLPEVFLICFPQCHACITKAYHNSVDTVYVFCWRHKVDRNIVQVYWGELPPHSSENYFHCTLEGVGGILKTKGQAGIPI